MATTITLRLLLVRNVQPPLRHTSLYLTQSRRYSLADEGVHISDSTISESSLMPNVALSVPALDEEERARVAEVRNVSRLSSNHYRQYHGQPPDLPYKDLHRRRMLYAQFGAASGEDPRILWPPRVKLLDQELEEQEEGSPLSERLSQLQSAKEAAEAAKIERRKVIAKNMSQMPKWIEEYRKKEEASEKAAKERATKKEALLQEAQDYYGYKIQANDPKFQQMVEEKELQEKKEKKKRTKEDKLQKQALRQQQEVSQMKEVIKEE